MPSVTLLGLAQDGGVPQASCYCCRCLAVHEGKSPELYPVSLGVIDDDGKFHLIEASRTLGRQLYLWSKATENLRKDRQMISSLSSVTLTHLHLGHIDGIGLFGREAIGSPNGSIRLISSKSVIEELRNRSFLNPFTPEEVRNQSKICLGKGVTIEFLRVPHREEEGSETYGIVIRGKEKALFFLPDHDTYEETLQFHQMDSIRSWLRSINVDLVLLDGTFFNAGEVHVERVDSHQIPHPPISETLKLLGRRDELVDPEIIFIHLNHTNPVINEEKRRSEISFLGWSIGQQGQVWML